MKRPNLHLIGVPECDEENESKLENTLQDIIQEIFPTYQSRPTFKKSNPKAHNHQIHQVGNEGKNAKGSQRERLGYPQRETYQTHSGSLGRKPISQKRFGTNIQNS